MLFYVDVRAICYCVGLYTTQLEFRAPSYHYERAVCVVHAKGTLRLCTLWKFTVLLGGATP
jgi:hypothetical protein